MPSITRSLATSWVFAALAVTATAGRVRAQDDPWRALVAEADSIGPETPRMAPSAWTPCAGVPAADSARVTPPADEFLFAARSLRTRGLFSYVELPVAGSGTFALRAILCDERGRPLTVVLERDHRYFYLVFSLRAVPSYRALTLLSADRRRCWRWREEHGRFAISPCPAAPGRKC
jgi:hypothetical protein